MKILIVKTSSLGDIIHTFPVLEYLKSRHPGCQIDWVVERPFAELVAAHPLVGTVFRVETRSWRKFKDLRAFKEFTTLLKATTYDVLFDFQGNMKSALINLLARAKSKAGFGRKSASEWPNLLTTGFKFDPVPSVNVREENLGLAQAFFNDPAPFQAKGVRLTISQDDAKAVEDALKGLQGNNKKLIVVCPGSAWPNKQMTEPSLIAFLKKIAGLNKARFLVVWGSSQEKEFAEKIRSALGEGCHVPNKLSLPQLQNLMDRADLVIAMDSLPLHLAGTTSAKTYGIFGSSSAEKYRPIGHSHHAFQGACPYGRTFTRRCPILRTCNTGACIRELDVDALFSDFERLNIL